ncbi:MAG: hypothetical protein KKB62_02725, partial [Nanoarchaeota archaeon]|nr:hypothetical protein [Nanoarchaeota archaeon]
RNSKIGMAPAIYVREKDKNRIAKIIDSFDLDYSLEKDFIENQNMEGFVYVPSINLYVAKEKKFHRKNWFEAHKLLQKEGEKMLTPYEFVEFLKYAKINEENVYNEITKLKSPWRAEWLDADFKVKNGVLHINYNHVLDSNGNLIPKNLEVLDKETLMKDKTPGISLEDYLESNHTSQGLPNKSVKSGDLYYWFPRSDDNSVAWFDADDNGADLNCNWDPSNRDDILGVRAVRRE